MSTLWAGIRLARARLGAGRRYSPPSLSARSGHGGAVEADRRWHDIDGGTSCRWCGRRPPASVSTGAAASTARPSRLSASRPRSDTGIHLMVGRAPPNVEGEPAALLPAALTVVAATRSRPNRAGRDRELRIGTIHLWPSLRLARSSHTEVCTRSRSMRRSYGRRPVTARSSVTSRSRHKRAWVQTLARWPSMPE
jgi:hypothetical protein